MLQLALLVVSALSVQAANWAVLVCGSKGFENYRHQADLFHLHQLLLARGFKRDQIISLAYDDAKDSEDNPFPGKVFNVPDETGPGVDVREGLELDYTGAEVTVANFIGVLLGNGTTGGTGRMLSLAPGDDVFVFYVDHGAPGILQFPDGDVLHADDFLQTIKQMHSQGLYGRLVIYIEACESGSILQDLPSNLSAYGVTAVGATKPSLGTYCGYDAVINGTQVGSCLGDLFAVYFMNYIAQGDGSNQMGDFFYQVKEQVAIYAALHYGNQEGEQYGDIVGFQNLTLSEFFYPDAATVGKLPVFVVPKGVLSAPRLEAERFQQLYTEASALPLQDDDGDWSYKKLKRATNQLQAKLQLQENIQKAMWRLVKLAYPDSPGHKKARKAAWRERQPPRNAACEKGVHNALVRDCGERADMSTSYAMQFHQVVVNLCADAELMWAQNPALGEAQAHLACGNDAETVI